MKKIFKWIGIILLLIILTVLIGGLVVSKHYSFEKRITLNAPQDSVWQHVNTLHGMIQWMPWSKLDPYIKDLYSEPDGVLGARYSWRGNKEVGEGEMTIDSITPKQNIKLLIHFIKPMDSRSIANINLTPKGNTTEVAWNMSFDMPYPFNFISKVCFNLDKQMDGDFSKGLNNLKTIVEKK